MGSRSGPSWHPRIFLLLIPRASLGSVSFESFQQQSSTFGQAARQESFGRRQSAALSPSCNSTASYGQSPCISVSILERLTCPLWSSTRNVSAGGGFLPRAIWRSVAEPERPRLARWFREPAVGTRASYVDGECCNAAAIARSRSWPHSGYRRSSYSTVHRGACR